MKRGAECETCKLNTQVVTYPPVRQSTKKLIIVGEGPGHVEERDGKFFAGPSGQKLNGCLREVGTARTDTIVNNATLCRPPKGFPPSHLRQAATACLPRLRWDLRYQAAVGAVIVAMGGAALWATAGKTSITPWVGAPLAPVGLPKAITTVLPVLHVAYAMRKPQYWVAVLRHLDLAYKLSIGKARIPRWPKLVLGLGDAASTRAVIAALKQIRARGEAVGLDIETAGKTPWAPITAVGIADTKESVSFLAHVFKRPKVLALVKAILYAQETIAQNGWHDVIGMREAGVRVRFFKHDTLFMHAAESPFMAHNLGIIAAIEAPGLDRWKSDFKDDDRKGSTEWETIAETDPKRLLTYNAKDAAILPRIKKSLWASVSKTGRKRRDYDCLMQIAKICAEMRTAGVQISKEIRDGHDVVLRKRRSRKITELRAAARDLGYGAAKRNELTPRRRSTMIDLLYRHMGLPVLGFTPKGDPAVDEGALIRLMLQLPDKKIQRLLRTILAYRKYDKLVGTYLAKLDPNHPDPHVDRNYVARPSFNAAGAGTRRLSCNDPNMQNWPISMRDMIVARDGKWLVSADLGQLEFRLEAAFAGDKPLLRAFASGADVHSLNAANIFGGFDRETPEARKELRTLAKRYAYGRRGGSPEAIWMSIIVEAPESGITISTIRKMDRAFKKAHPRLGKYQNSIVSQARTADYIELPLTGRRIHYHGKVVPTEPPAHNIQGTAADIMNAAMIKLRKSLNPKKEQLILQIHDDMMLETSDPVGTAEKMRDAMAGSVTLNGNEVELTIDYKLGRNLGRATACDSIADVRAAV